MPTKPSERVTVGTGEAARILGVSPSAVLSWVTNGKLAAFRTPGGTFRINRDDVLKVMQTEEAS